MPDPGIGSAHKERFDAYGEAGEIHLLVAVPFCLSTKQFVSCTSKVSGSALQRLGL
jgi:hypothetical protein